MPNYKEKFTNPLTDEEFIQGMKEGNFVKRPEHPGLIALLHYSAVRISEALKTRRNQLRFTPKILYYDVGERLKHSLKTPPLVIPLEAPFVDCILDSFVHVKPDRRVWPYCRKTGYNIVHRVFKYPHYHRLSRITWFFMPHPEIGRPSGFSIAEVRSWTGLTLKALDYYIGLVGIEKMGAAMAAKHDERDRVF